MELGLARLAVCPRLAIIACYARLEYLLEDHGVPAYHHLTPQEYMGTAVRGLDCSRFRPPPADCRQGSLL